MLWPSLDLVFLALSAWAVVAALQQVGRSGPGAVFALAWTAFAAGLIGERLGWPAGETLTYGGSTVLIGAHLWRLKGDLA